MAPKLESRRKIGRPPAGARDGEKVKDYPQLSIRLPPEIKSTLRALSIVTGRPQWRLITDAIGCYLTQRPDVERQRVEDLVRRSRTTTPRRSPRLEGK